MKFEKNGRILSFNSDLMKKKLLANGWQEVKEGQKQEMTHVGAGWYELPNGERVRGKENALEKLGE